MRVPLAITIDNQIFKLFLIDPKTAANLEDLANLAVKISNETERPINYHYYSILKVSGEGLDAKL